MRLLYNIGTCLYFLIILAVSPFNKKANLFRRGRKQWHQRLQQALPEGAPIAWFHCSSLGEFEQGRPLLEAYRKQFPAHKILLTFFSPSGYEVRKNTPCADWVFYLPLDTPRNARKFVDTVNPVIAIFIKYDFWYNLLHTLKKQVIPTYVASAIFRPSQPFFKWYGGFFRKMLHTCRAFFVQDEASAKLLATIGITNVFVTGDTRFDRVWELSQTPEEIPVIAHFSGGRPTLIAGSTWPADEEKLAAVFAALPDTTQLVIAPHEIHEEHLAAIEKCFAPFGVQRYSNGQRSTVNNGQRYTVNGQRSDKRIDPLTVDRVPCTDNSLVAPLTVDRSPCTVPRVLVMDTMGMLSSVYRYGTAAYIGGGFGAGIHNTLEAAVYGIPVVFGPNYRRFREACGLIAQGGAASYTTTEELTAILKKWLADNRAGKRNKQYIAQHRGATETIMKLLKQ